ncbi:hypothetical protein GX48_04760 [Paracoccidioides brasiliensis]|nr:hypothetical protein GX48_04760 [Paracoccidioides brasiliensis]
MAMPLSTAALNRQETRKCPWVAFMIPPRLGRQRKKAYLCPLTCFRNEVLLYQRRAVVTDDFHGSQIG